MLVKEDKNGTSTSLDLINEVKDDSSCHAIGEKKNANPNPGNFGSEFLVILNQALIMLRLSKNNAEGLGDCQRLSFCLDFFGKNKHSENDDLKDAIKFKQCVVNSFHHKLMNDTVLEKRFNF